MTLWRGESPLILATQSRVRQMLLANAGLDFEAIPAEIDERGMQQSSGLTSPGDVAALLAREKARAVSGRRPGQFAVGADQTLALGTRLFSKPAGRAQAAEQLRALAGKRHELHSAVAVARDGRILFETVSVAGMTMRPLTGAEIEAYLNAAGEPVTSSVGAYQLEGLGVHLFERIEGDHFTILGLPLLQLLAFLRSERLLAV
jgi:septum formation protein